MVRFNRTTPPDWTDEENDGENGARCRMFKISRDDDGVVRNDAWFQDAEEALSVCNGDYVGTPCPLRDTCLLIGLVNNDLFGVFGGMTGPQRKWVRRNVPKENWEDADYLRAIIPPITYFKDVGDSDPEEDAFA